MRLVVPLGLLTRLVELPPAIRPGLHCGGDWVLSQLAIGFASPGHQAGAPLRPPDGRSSSDEPEAFPRPSGRGSIAALAPRVVTTVPVSFPRPSGRGSIAAGRRGSLCQWWTDFPRPSGRGSIAATATVQRWRSRWPPSPGHQAGAPLRPHSARTHRTFPAPPSPGHQAGAPLRRARAALVR